jgi:hypothetical protein
MKCSLIPVRYVLVFAAILLSGIAVFAQSDSPDTSLEGKKTIFVGRTPEQQAYYAKIFGSQSGLVLVSDIKDADLVLDVAYVSDSGTDTPRGTRVPNAVSSRPPDYKKKDSDRQRYVYDSKVTVRVFTRSGNSADTLVWEKSKKRRSTSGGMAPNMPASWERLTPDTIPAHNLPPKDVVPGLIKSFLKDFAKAQ